MPRVGSRRIVRSVASTRMMTDHTHRHSRLRSRTGTLRLRTPIVTVVTLALLALAALPVRETLYLTVVRAGGSSFLAPLVGLMADKGLLLLVATTAGVTVLTWVRDRAAFWTLVVAGVGTVAAYLVSEGIKLVVSEQRPCRVLEIDTVLACPPPGDWSWPSNHSVLAAAFATACVVALPRIRALVLPLAMVIAGSRVAAGVHYVHDVLSGLALGVLIVVLTVAVLRPVVDQGRGGPRRDPEANGGE